MHGSNDLIAFSLLALGMALTPGPNMIYLLSRSITQGRLAGMTSLGGVALAFLFYMLFASFGITALLLAVPYAHDALRFGGAAYLLYLAWQAVRPGAKSPFEVQKLRREAPSRLFTMGFITSFLNPKAAVFYLSLLPQFIHPENGSIFGQSVTLGLTQISISLSVNAIVILIAGSMAGFLASRPTWLVVQRWVMGTVLAGLAVRLATDTRR
ncbi:MAG: LysE family translocator [Sphingosinicella sp.]|nr:LysE family translocator [Sphingosinicella sp.]